VNVDDVEAAVEEMGALLRLDGADLTMLEANPKTARIEVALDMDGVECEDCVMPPEMLEQMISDAVARRVRGEFELVLRDPRRVGGVPS
jgi:Fe-S cluster biogenesis protein NfuA